MTDTTLAPIKNSALPLSTLVRAVADDVEQVATTDDLQQHAPTEGRVAEVAAGTRPNDVYVGTGDTWALVSSELGFEVASLQATPQDLTAGDAPAPTDAGVQAAHDGTGTPPAGTYTSDPPNDQWVGADDTTSGTTIAY
ncbi:hypothetical protein [Halorubrum distributum]|uniref:Uncharacterized protein n=1 Tax=Halorubrum distributum TaxID=29283 RepID=A0A6B1IKH9_9EURY|nr:hypothetical protein [Halorubrum terrestre]MYL15675.1 hypothetical protein [Halorubrum terrestre]MYL67796.1 hypothetical protein [Halorubrum terrestre]